MRLTRLSLWMCAATLVFGVSCAVASSSSPPADQPQPPSGPRPDPATIRAWQDRKFGMFIHFGLFSLPGGMWDGRPVTRGYSEQILAQGRLPMDRYEAQAARFDPTAFDADAIVALAKAAGMRFIVLAAKHHDGFAMFHTAQNHYNIVDATPYRRDVVKELADACARARMPFGVYYSSIDWHWMRGQFDENNGNPITPAQADFNVAQIRELLSRYGPIAEIWFDMGKPTPAQSARFAAAVHALQPRTMVSGRVWNHQGDFSVMGDNREPEVAIEEPWQSPASIFPETWGYRAWQQRSDLDGKVRENIARLVRVVSAGGNYLLNIGPRGDGAVVPYEADVLRGIGAWLAPRGAAIYGTRASPFARLDFGYATLGAHALYLFVATPPADGVLRLPGVLDTRFGAAQLLGGGGATADVRVDAAGARVDVRELHLERAGFMPVLAVPLESALHVRPDAAIPDARGTATLDVAKAQHFYNRNGEGYEDPDTLYKLRWFAALDARDYALTLRYTAAAPARVDLVVDGRRQTLALDRTGAKPMERTIAVRRDRTASPYAMAVEVTPVEPFRRGDALPIAVTSLTLAPR